MNPTLNPEQTDTAPGLAPAGSPPERTWHLRLAYDGTAFHGWQSQPGQRTVQDQLRQRLMRLLRAGDLALAGTSRTDAGVHALDQHVSLTVPTPPEWDGESLRRRLNRWLPEDIRVQQVTEEPAGFHARHGNCGKAYTYCLYHGEKISPLFARYAWALPQRLDLEPMRAAGRRLEGEHDFTSFAVNPKREVESTICRLYRVEVLPLGELVCVSVVGDRFLYKMVRSLVGYLVHVGQGKAAPESVERVLQARDRGAAAQSAPAAGLFLARVFFSVEEREGYTPRLPPFAWDEGS